MCDTCRVIYHIDTKHDASVCPIRSALRCSVCEVYGHSTMRCPDKATWQTRVPEYVEQLVPPSLLRHHNIKTATPILMCNLNPVECSYPPVLEVLEDKTGTVIRSTLSSFNLPSSSVKENKRVLIDFGKLIGKNVTFLQNTNVVKEKPAKKVIKTKKNAASGAHSGTPAATPEAAATPA